MHPKLCPLCPYFISTIRWGDRTHLVPPRGRYRSFGARISSSVQPAHSVSSVVPPTTEAPGPHTWHLNTCLCRPPSPRRHHVGEAAPPSPRTASVMPWWHSIAILALEFLPHTHYHAIVARYLILSIGPDRPKTRARASFHLRRKHPLSSRSSPRPIHQLHYLAASVCIHA